MVPCTSISDNNDIVVVIVIVYSKFAVPRGHTPLWGGEGGQLLGRCWHAVVTGISDDNVIVVIYGIRCFPGGAHH
jgi:hypothetical protein